MKGPRWRTVLLQQLFAVIKELILQVRLSMSPQAVCCKGMLAQDCPRKGALEGLY